MLAVTRYELEDLGCPGLANAVRARNGIMRQPSDGRWRTRRLIADGRGSCLGRNCYRGQAKPFLSADVPLEHEHMTATMPGAGIARGKRSQFAARFSDGMILPKM